MKNPDISRFGREIAMDILRIDSLSGQTTIHIMENAFCIEGNYLYLVNKEFQKVKNAKDSCPLKEFMGVGILSKRSPRKLFQFVLIAAALEFVNMLAGKIGDILFFMDTDWTAYVVNFAAVLCILQGLRLFFSKRKVYEISFLKKRFCVDEKDFNKQDIDKMNEVIRRLI